MKKKENIEALQNAWRERSGSGSGDSCPDPAKFWDAQSGELPRHEVDALVAHTTSCPACAEAWRLAREMGAMDEREVVTESIEAPVRATPWWRLRPVALAAGLLFLIGAGLTLFLARPEPDPTDQKVTFRDTGPDAVRALAPEEKPLPRDACRLTWTPGPEGSRYTLRVTTEDLENVHLAEGLEKPELIVPAEKLEALAPNTRLMWQVQVFTPDGRRIQSPTFFVIIR
jgi:hypothetical protein